MASPNSNDALGLLSAALSASDAASEAKHLRELYNVLAAQPGNVPILFPSILSLLSRANEPMRKWIADVMDLAFCRPTLSIEGRAALAVHVPDAILSFVQELQQTNAKAAAQCFASAYQALFRHVCQDRQSQAMWSTIVEIKSRLAEMYETSHLGIKIAVLKCFQRIIQVQTRGSADPRVQNRNDPNLNLCPPDHPFLRVNLLEAEANKLLTMIVTLVFTSHTPDLVMAAINCLSTLAKLRTQIGKIVLEAMISWTPAALAEQSHVQVRNVEKTVRLLFFHFLRNGIAGNYAPQIAEALEKQKLRMEAAARAYHEHKELEAKRKREVITDEISHSASKRQRVEEPQIGSGPTGGDVNGLGGAAAFRDASQDDSRANPLASFDVTTLPVKLVIELIIANLQALTDADLHGAISRTRHNLDRGSQPGPPGAPAPQPSGAPSAPADQVKAILEQTSKASTSAPSAPDGPSIAVKAEPLDPLKMDIGDEELETLEREQPEAEAPDTDAISAGPAHVFTALENFTLPPPEPMRAEESDGLIRSCIARMCDVGALSGPGSEGRVIQSDKAQQGGDGSFALWATLVTRLATRGFFERPKNDESESEETGQGAEMVRNKGGRSLRDQADAVRQMMLDFVKADFSSRSAFATFWLAEEWHCDRLRRKEGEPECYTTWLSRLVDALLPEVDGKDKSLASFLADLPRIPDDVTRKVSQLCLDKEDKERMAVGFTFLREVASTRPPSRALAMDLLLHLTRHEDKVTRGAAIITARAWVTQAGPLDQSVRSFALDSLQHLGAKPKEAEGLDGSAQNGDAAKENGDADEQAPPESEIEVQRFVELPFALCVKVPEMLDEIFKAFPSMSPVVQEAVQKHIAALIRSLGPNNGKLLTLLRTFPPGADSLALCVFKILTEKGRTPALVALVKGLAAEREVNPRFLVPIMPDLDKAEIMRHLPRVVTILSSGSPEDKSLVKSVFQSIVTMPPQGFGSVSTNLPRVRQTELLTPVELMGLLHHAEKEIGLKNAVSAIQICFSMTDVYRSEVLGAVLNQLVEETNLPMLFMRTVISAVSTYKSLSGYVSTNLLSRLITKKIWQNAPLWDGFIRCAKQTAPGSFGALFQLPREQLREVVSRQPDLKAGLREYLAKKAGGNRARSAQFLELLGPDDETTQQPAAAPAATDSPRSSAPGTPVP